LSIAVEVPVVTMDVVAATQHGDIITGLKRENFKLFEDGVPQTITTFGPSDAPITMVVLMEFSARYGGYFSYVAKYWTEPLFPQLKETDWIPLVHFDMKPNPAPHLPPNTTPIPHATSPPSLPPPHP